MRFTNNLLYLVWVFKQSKPVYTWSSLSQSSGPYKNKTWIAVTKWDYKGRISRSELWCDTGTWSRSLEALISWTGGGLTTVMGMTKLSERRFFISRCSWQTAQKWRTQCTIHGSHGEFCLRIFKQQQRKSYFQNSFKVIWTSQRIILGVLWCTWRWYFLCRVWRTFPV